MAVDGRIDKYSAPHHVGLKGQGHSLDSPCVPPKPPLLRSRRGVFALIACAAVLTGLPAGLPHPGSGDDDPTFPGVLQGETYDEPDAVCDPAPNGLHTRMVQEVEAWASGDKTTLLPYSGCGVTFDEVTFVGVCRFLVFSVAFTGPPGPWTAIVTAYSDGVEINKGVLVVEDNDRGTFQFLEHFTRNVQPGEHEIRVQYDAASPGFADTRMRLDRLDASPACLMWNR